MGGNPVLDLIAYHDPGLHTVIRVWYYAAPAVAVVLAGSVCLSVWRVWLQPPARGGGRGGLPAWPTSPEDDAAPSLVDRRAPPSRRSARERAALLARRSREGALHRRPRRRRGRHRQDLGLHVSVRPAAPLVASRPGRAPGQRPGARGQGRLLSTACGGSSRRPGAAATTSRSGSTARCSGTRSTIRCSTPTRSPTASPPSSTSSSARAANRSGSKPIRISCAGIIELYRLLPGGWVTLQDIYRCTVEAELFGRKIGEARELADRLCPVRATVATKDLAAHKAPLGEWGWRHPAAIATACGDGHRREYAASRDRGSTSFPERCARGLADIGVYRRRIVPRPRRGPLRRPSLHHPAGRQRLCTGTGSSPRPRPPDPGATRSRS